MNRRIIISLSFIFTLNYGLSQNGGDLSLQNLYEILNADSTKVDSIMSVHGYSYFTSYSFNELNYKVYTYGYDETTEESKHELQVTNGIVSYLTSHGNSKTIEYNLDKCEPVKNDLDKDGTTYRIYECEFVTVSFAENPDSEKESVALHKR